MESGQIYINIEAPNMRYDINIRRRLIRSRRWKLSNGKSWMVRTKQRAYKLGTFRVICDSVTQTFMLRPFILSETCKKNWRNFPMTANFKKSTKDFCLLRENKWRYFCKTGMYMRHMSDQYWNNTWGSAAQFFLAQTDHQSWGIFNGEVPSNNATQNQQILQFTCVIVLWTF